MVKNNVDKALIRALAQLLHENNLTEIEYDNDGVKIKVACNNSAPAANVVAVPVSASVPKVASVQEKPVPAPAPVNVGEKIKSPMVGIVYVSSEPLAKPYVKVGDMVTKGQTLFLIEAMKTFNAVKAPRAGRVLEILVKDSDFVEYDEPLLILE